MKKGFAILFLTVFAVANTELGQLFKIPLLVEHYYTHQAEVGSLSLLDFLTEHYAADHYDEDMAEDMQLPFKSITHTTFSNLFVAPPAVLVKSPTQVVSKNRFCLNDEFALSQTFFSIFHPPRVA
jgi:hypothetical protein